METTTPTEFEQELLDRGYSRRQLAKVTALLGAGAVAMRTVGAAAQQAAKPVEGAVRIGANECWTGPFPVAAEAAFKLVTEGNRYEPDNEHEKLFAAVAQVEGIPADRIVAWPGSSDPLSRVAVAFASPTKGIVTADPTYEAIWRTGAWLGAKVTKVPLTPGYRHDVKAMLTANPDAGLYYICSPNNPTGTLTPLADIEWLVVNKPAGSIVLVDEAYLHFSHGQSAAPLVGQGKDVIVLRTFSKLFGMAGMRLGATIARPDLHARMMRYDGKRMSTNLPLPSVVCGTVALTQKALIEQRRAEMIAARDFTFAHLTKRGVKFIPSDANMFMVDWGKPAAGVQAQFLAAGVGIGRNWAPWPTMSRVTVGFMADMQAFCAALDRIMV